MSWLARSIANSLKFDYDDEDDIDPHSKPEEHPKSPESRNTENSYPTTLSRGVKEDLSEFGKTLTRQLWGVASFLAPPPQPAQKPYADVPKFEEEEDPILGVRDDFAKIGGKFRSGIYRLSNNINVSEITKMASNLLQLESDDDSERSRKRISLDTLGKEAVSVTEEVVTFARDISMHPETWLDFPLPEIVGDGPGFIMSDAQHGHALAIERLAPSLPALKVELCPAYMSESNFWKIYFVLLHPRLDKQDAELLLTPQIVEARSLLAYELKNRKTTKLENLSAKKTSDSEKSSKSSLEKPLSEPSTVSSKNKLDDPTDLSKNTSAAKATSETGNHPTEMNKIQSEDKIVIAEKDFDRSKAQQLEFSEVNTLGGKYEDEADDWLKEGSSEIGRAIGKKTIAIENDDDVSFSDLEEDDGEASDGLRKSNSSSDKDSQDWVRLGMIPFISSMDESNDWLDIDDDILLT